MNGLLPYILGGVFIILGLLCLRAVFKKRNEVKKLVEKEMPLTGKGSKLHMTYLGIVLIGLGVYILFRNFI